MKPKKFKLNKYGFITLILLLVVHILVGLTVYLNELSSSLPIVILINSLIILGLLIYFSCYSLTIYENGFELRTVLRKYKYNFKDVIIKRHMRVTRIFDTDFKLKHEVPIVIDINGVLHETYNDYIYDNNIDIKVSNNVVSYNKKRLLLYILSTILGILFLLAFFLFIYWVLNKIEYHINDEYIIPISFALGIIGLSYGLNGLLKYRNNKIIINYQTITIKNFQGEQFEYHKKEVTCEFIDKRVYLNTPDKVYKFTYRDMDNIDLLIYTINEYHEFLNSFKENNE